MKRKSGTSAGIPRASGERGSPGAPARDKEVRKAPSPLSRDPTTPCSLAMWFFFFGSPFLCCRFRPSPHGSIGSEREGEGDTQVRLSPLDGRGVAGGLVWLASGRQHGGRWAGWGRVAARIHAAAPAQHHHHVLLVKGVGAWHARALASGRRRDGPFPLFCRNMAHKTTSVSLIDAGTGS